MSNLTATQQLGTVKVSKLLLQYAIPAIIAQTAAVLYNIADSIFVGHGVGPLAISALAITMPMMNLGAAFGAMVGAGASALMSIKLGQNDRQSAKLILGNVVLLNLIIGASFGGLCLIFLGDILRMFGASEATMGYAKEYLGILMIGNVFTHMYMGLNNVLRAVGAPKQSMAIMVFAVLFNCVLDAIFIFWFKWGIAGAAWATVLAQFIAMVLELWYFSGKRVEVSFSKEIFKLKKRIVGGILSIGMAPFLMNVTASVVVIFINNALQNNGGDMYIGAYGIANRVSFIFIMMVFGLNQGMQPIVGYNYGAKKYDRVHKALMMVIIAATCITTVGSLLCMIFPHAVAGIFTNDPTLLAIAEKALRITLLAFPIVGFQVVGSNFFQSIGMAPKAIFLSLTRQLIFLLPCLIILPPIFGANGVWMSLPIADTIASILTAILLVHQIRVFRRHNAQNNLNAM